MTATLFCPHCATANVVDATICRSCNRPLPKRVEVYASEGGGGGRDLAGIDERSLVEKSKVRSPFLAGFFGFVLPFVGAFYNGKVVLGFVLLGLELVFDGIGPFTAGVPAVLYHVVGGILSHQWATKANAKALEKLAVRQR